eukprot:1190219-Amphidinium_carterae.1
MGLLALPGDSPLKQATRVSVHIDMHHSARGQANGRGGRSGYSGGRGAGGPLSKDELQEPSETVACPCKRLHHGSSLCCHVLLWLILHSRSGIESRPRNFKADVADDPGLHIFSLPFVLEIPDDGHE